MTNAVATIIHAVSPVSIFGSGAGTQPLAGEAEQALPPAQPPGGAGGLVTASSANKKPEMLNIQNYQYAQ